MWVIEAALRISSPTVRRRPPLNTRSMGCRGGDAGGTLLHHDFVFVSSLGTEDESVRFCDAFNPYL